MVSFVRKLSAEEKQQRFVELNSEDHDAILQQMGHTPGKRVAGFEPEDPPPKRHAGGEEGEEDWPPNIRLAAGAKEWACLWCLRRFNHPPAWTVHRKTCRWDHPLFKRPSDELEPAQMRTGRLRLLNKSGGKQEWPEIWYKRVETLARGHHIAWAEEEDSDEGDGDEEEEEEGQDEQEKAEAERQRKAAEAAQARSMRAVKRLVGNLPSEPRRVTVEVVLSMCNTEEIAAILQANIQDFDGEKVGSEGEPERVLMAKRLVAVIKMRLQEAQGANYVDDDEETDE